MSEAAWYEDDDERGSAKPGRRPTREALRLTFRFDGDRVELTAVTPLRKLVPPPIGPEPEAGRHTGEWLQLLDADNRVLHTRVLHDPLRTRVEVHDPDHGPRIVVGPPAAGTFDVLVPDLPEAVSAVLYASPPVEEGELRPAVDVARFDLPRDRRDGTS